MLSQYSFNLIMDDNSEEHVIIDTLNSVYKHIDYWVICDTGSTDNTCKLISDCWQVKLNMVE